MMEDLPLFIEDNNGNKHYIHKELGSGGQGSVFSTKDKNIAIKLIKHNQQFKLDPIISENLNEKIEEVVSLPLRVDLNLSKPEVLLKPPFSGYVMKLLDLDQLENLSNVLILENYTTLNNTYKLNKRIEVLIELSRMLSVLHSDGFVYCDLSPNNVFFSNQNQFSKVWLIDCDNIRFSNQITSSIFTPGYGAPEIVSGLSINSIQSDIFSFAIVAFKTLFLRSPFELNKNNEAEDAWDSPNYVSQKRTFKKQDYVYIGDENNPTHNTFQKDVMQRFSNPKLLELFKRTFNQNGVTNPLSRPLMDEWYKAMIKLYSQLTKCSNPNCNIIHRINYKDCFGCGFKNTELIVKNNVLQIGLIPRPEYALQLMNSINQDWDKLHEEPNLTKHNQLNFSALDFYQSIADIKIYPGKKVYNFELSLSSLYEYPSLVFEFLPSQGSTKLILYNHATSEFFDSKNNRLIFKHLLLEKNIRIYDPIDSKRLLNRMYFIITEHE